MVSGDNGAGKHDVYCAGICSSGSKDCYVKLN